MFLCVLMERTVECSWERPASRVYHQLCRRTAVLDWNCFHLSGVAEDHATRVCTRSTTLRSAMVHLQYIGLLCCNATSPSQKGPLTDRTSCLQTSTEVHTTSSKFSLNIRYVRSRLFQSASSASCYISVYIPIGFRGASSNGPRIRETVHAGKTKGAWWANCYDTLPSQGRAPLTPYVEYERKI